MTTLRDHIQKSPHRSRLERHLKRILPNLQGAVLDIGSRNRRYDHLFKQPPTAIDIVENRDLNIQYGDIVSLSFGDESFDAVVCLEVLEYISDPKRAIQEIHRVLKKDGTLILSIPFMFKEHEDVQRYTSVYMRELLSGFTIEEFSAVGGSLTVITTIWWGKIKTLRSRVLRYVLLAFLLPFLYMRSSKHTMSSYASGYIVVAKKKS